jgi:erythronate-4-phosphate dehydrogenase
MRIVVDEHIPYAQEAFSTLGDVRSYSGRSIGPESLANADALIVRSITGVNASLLEKSSIQFVATATSGMEHIDSTYLAETNITFAHAQGANARSVAEYVLAAILKATSNHAKPLSSYRCGIVGFGHVGSTVYSLLNQVGIQCGLYDPFLKTQNSELPFISWDEIVQQDIITFHTPLTHDGAFPTHHMINKTFLEDIQNSCILINAARGGVMDTEAMVEMKVAKPGLCYVLDVWENEPDISKTLLDCSSIATPHIAGYSWDAKVNATRRVYTAACQHFNTPSIWTGPSSELERIHALQAINDLGEGELRDYVQALHPIQLEDVALRKVAEAGRSLSTQFDKLRNTNTPRREYSVAESTL